MTIAIALSSLSPDLLARRLRELAGEERDVQVDFLLHLDEFDRRRAFLEAGYGSLWEYCLPALHLREGPAGRRIAAMRAVRRFPALEPALRDGRLCLSTVTLVAPLLEEENLDEVVARAAFKTKAEVEHLVASMQPRSAPKDGVRRLAGRAGWARRMRMTSSQFPAVSAPTNAGSLAIGPAPVSVSTPETVLVAVPVSTPTLAPVARDPIVRPPVARSALERPLVELRPVSGEEWSLRVTLDAEMKADLETLKALLGHKAGGDLAAVVRESLRCAVEKHGKRRGAARPARARVEASACVAGADSAARREEAARPAATTRHIPAAVRRAVWERDRGRCAWTSGDGHRCGSTWKLELDHVIPVARGGPSTFANLRLTCRAHNLFHAEQQFGREHMARFVGRRVAAAAQGSLIPG